jgi:hypothetical protein
VLCVAPAGSGKTTTLVARIAWRIGDGTDPASIAALTFNRRAADELRGRLDEAVEPLGGSASAIRVRTFHALGPWSADAGSPVEPLLDRTDVVPELPAAQVEPAGLRRLDDAFRVSSSTLA